MTIITAFLLMLNLSSCDKPQQNYHTANVPSTSDSITTDQEARLIKDYNEYFHADIALPDDIPDHVDILYAKPFSFSENTLVELFFDNGAPQRESDSLGNEIFYQGTDGSYLNISTDLHMDIHYRNAADIRVKLPTENFGTKHTEIMLPDSYTPRFDIIYKQKDLTGFSREQAVSAAMTIFDGLGLSVSDDIEIYAVDHETMQEYTDSVIANEPDVIENYDIVEAYTEDDDFYLLGFSITFNGLPITQRSYTDPTSGRYMQGSYSEVRVSRNGITRLDMSCPWTVCGIADTVQNLVSPEYAVDKVFSEFDSANSQIHAAVTDIALEYIAIPSSGEDDTVLLVPAWDITLALEFDVGEYLHKMYSINAVSGEIIGKLN